MAENRKNGYIVYVHTSPSGKKYVGITQQKPSKRWKNGLGYNIQPYFFKAIQKYGWDNFEHEILYRGLTKEQAEEKEMLLIALYQSNDFRYGYNLSNGGQCSETMTDRTKRLLSESRKGKPVEHFERYLSGKRRGVIQYSLSMEMIREFESATEAERETGALRGAITKACDGRGYTAKGYIWRWTQDDESTCAKDVSEKLNKINQYDLDGNFIKQWNSNTEATNYYGLPVGSISKACKGIRKSAGGFIWEYTEEPKTRKRAM